MTAIAYAGNVIDPKQARIATWFYRIALTLGIAPMAIGVGIVVLYWAAWWDGLVGAGLLMLPAGVVLITLGLAFLIVWGLLERKQARIEVRGFNHKKFWLTALLLLLNVPVAIGCCVGGIYLAGRSSIEIVNETGAPIDNCTVHAGGGKIALGGIPAGGRVRYQSHDTISGIEVTQGAQHFDSDLYNDSGPLGRQSRVRVEPGLKPQIEVLNVTLPD